MELIESGKLKILKGEKLVVVNMKVELNLEGNMEFFEFVDGLLQKGYRIIQSESSSKFYGHLAVMVKD
jgi:hypothetical protein